MRDYFDSQDDTAICNSVYFEFNLIFTNFKELTQIMIAVLKFQLQACQWKHLSYTSKRKYYQGYLFVPPT